MQLSRRLTLIASMVDKTDSVADVGTDHGYVPIYLVENNIVSKAIAMDINQGPLTRADENIKSKGLDNRITTRLSDGVRELKPGETDAIVVAGMGGQLIIKILEEGRNVFKSAKQIILSPHSDVEMVRRYLTDNDYYIQDEAMVIDDGKYYTVIKVINNTESCSGEEYDREEYFLYGKRLLEKKDEVLKMFLEKEESNIHNILDKIKGGNEAVVSAKGSELNKKLQVIQRSKLYYG